LVLNSWMHTPAGFEMINGEAFVTDWWAVIFNPSFPYRFTHMMLASGLTVAFLVAGLSAYRWLHGDRSAAVRSGLSTGAVLGAVLIPLQIVAGDLHGLNTLEHQPAKVAAMEGIWETQRGAPAVLFAIPDSEARENRFEIAIPNLASLYLTHEWDGEVRGLNDFKGQHPPVAPVFWAFRAMVGVGLLMLALSWFTVWKLKPWRAGAAKDPHAWLVRAWVAMSFSGWVAVVAGWYVTEIGRQPWLVNGVLRTAEAATTTPAPYVAFTLALYLTVYAALMVAYVSVVFYLARKAARAALGQSDPSPAAAPGRRFPITSGAEGSHG
jgi:cytochrome d ubiquinol oxidase subunit I